MVIDSNSEWDVQAARFEAEALVPFWIQIPMYDGTAVLETTTLEFDVRITAACKGCVCVCVCVCENKIIISHIFIVMFGINFNIDERDNAHS